MYAMGSKMQEPAPQDPNRHDEPSALFDHAEVEVSGVQT